MLPGQSSQPLPIAIIVLILKGGVFLAHHTTPGPQSHRANDHIIGAGHRSTVASANQSAILEAKHPPKEGIAMCDYSLAHYPNRLACEGEQLVVYRFSSGTLGLVSSRPSLRDLVSGLPAICVPPGARLVLQDIPERLQQVLGVSAVEEVTFTEQNAEDFTHRDAVRFASGREVLLQNLACGQRVDVLSVSGASEEVQGIRNQKAEQPDRDVAVSQRFLPTIPRN
jgi:hypothetical protein